MNLPKFKPQSTMQGPLFKTMCLLVLGFSFNYQFSATATIRPEQILLDSMRFPRPDQQLVLHLLGASSLANSSSSNNTNNNNNNNKHPVD